MSKFVNQRDYKRNTALMLLAKLSDFEKEYKLSMFKELVEAGAYLDLQNYKGETALMIAAKNGNEIILEQLLESGANPNLQNYMGKTALMLAIMYEKFDIAELIIMSVVDLNIQDNDEETALLIASDLYNESTEETKKSYHEIIKLLIHSYADVDLKNFIGVDILMTLSMYAKNDDDLELIKLLIDLGADPNSVSHYGSSPIFYGIINDYGMATKVVEFLLKSGADPNLVNDDSETPLFSVIWGNQIGKPEELIRILVEGGADPNFRLDETTLLHRGLPSIECDDGYIRLYKMLFKYGADPNLIDPRGKTLLHQICENSSTFSVDMLKFLVDQGANINHIDINRRNMLFILAIQEINENSYLMVEFLLQSGININYRDHADFNALYYFCLNYDEYEEHKKIRLKIIRLLIISGSTINVRDEDFHSIFSHVSISFLEDCIAEKVLIKDNKRRFSKIIKEINVHCSRIKLHPDNYGAKILEYSHICKKEGNEITFDLIKLEVPYLIDYLNIHKPEDLNKLSEYKELL
jgi:ankyrin repeat protein